MLDELARPLIPTSGERDAEHEDDSSSEHAQAPANEGDIARANPFVWGLTITAGVSGLLFGYDTGVISSTLVSIRDSLSHRQLTTLDKSLITSATSFFALVASPITGFLADALGRKKTILIASGLFIIGALLQALAATVWTMVFGRSVVGLAIGSAATVVPTYIAELAPSAFRGRLVVVLVLLITGGQVVAYIVGWALSENEAGWRWMVGLGAVPAACQLGMLGLMPETSRWLVKRGRNDEAIAVLQKVFGGRGKEEASQAMVAATLYRIQEEHREEQAAVAALATGRGAESSRWTSRSGIRSLHNLFTIGRNRRALAIACALQGFQNLSGFNCLMVRLMVVALISCRLTGGAVFFRDNLFSCRLPIPHPDLSQHRHYQFPLHCRGVQGHRQRWPSSDVALLDTIHVFGIDCLCCHVQPHRSAPQLRRGHKDKRDE